jgi:nucleoside-diphosphate-sugar epimerase
MRHPNLQYISLDITDNNAVAQVFESSSADTLIHLAALVHVRDPLLSFSDYSRMNFRASEFVFQSAIASGIRRILFASTVEVYGRVPQNGLVSESTSCRPDTDYARTKLLAEEALRRLAVNGEVTYAILRLAPVYSRDFRLNLDKRLYLGAGRLGYYLGRGEYSLSLCSIHNIAHFVWRWLEQASPQVAVYNLADEHNYPIKSILERERQAGRCPVTLALPYWPCAAAVSAIEWGLSLAGRTSGMLNVDNVRKLTSSTVWVSDRAQAAVGGLPWGIENTLYDRH